MLYGYRLVALECFPMFVAISPPIHSPTHLVLVNGRYLAQVMLVTLEAGWDVGGKSM